MIEECALCGRSGELCGYHATGSGSGVTVTSGVRLRLTVARWFGDALVRTDRSPRGNSVGRAFSINV